eukprot:gene4372-3178_t
MAPPARHSLSGSCGGILRQVRNGFPREWEVLLRICPCFLRALVFHSSGGIGAWAAGKATEESTHR